MGPSPSSPDTRYDRPLADPRFGARAVPRDGADRLSLCRDLVSLDGHQDLAAHGAVHARPPRDVGNDATSRPARARRALDLASGRMPPGVELVKRAGTRALSLALPQVARQVKKENLTHVSVRRLK